MSSDTRDPDYVLGTSDTEHERLRAQAELVDPFTRRLFRAAGLAPGMRVLDIGCGAGDVSMLVSRLIGPSGQVVGVDREGPSLATARRRTAVEGLDNITFLEADFRELDPAFGTFDALVGRLVLMYQPDPAVALGRIAERVRPGGIIAFHEHDLSLPAMAHPPMPLREQVSRWLWETFRRSGAEISMGYRLLSTFRGAGLGDPRIMVEGIVDTPASSYSWALMTRVMLPRIVEFGIATEDEVDIDTLDARLAREIEAAESVAVGFLAFGAWSRRPETQDETAA